jgi:hypothetical protein
MKLLQSTEPSPKEEACDKTSHAHGELMRPYLTRLTRTILGRQHIPVALALTWNESQRIGVEVLCNSQKHPVSIFSVQRRRMICKSRK